MLTRRFRLMSCLMLAAIGSGCDSSSGPMVPSLPSKAEEASATAPSAPPKAFDKGRALNAAEAPPGGLPSKATP
jgi:hypothetical protein